MNGSVAISDSGTAITYKPAANFHGADSFTYTVSDGRGGTDTATVSVTVTSINDAPDAVNDTTVISEDSNANTISVLANDIDPDRDALTVTAKTNGTNGAIAITNGGKELTYTPNQNFNGSDSFTYTISDGNGGTDKATVTVTITPVNDNPDAVNDSTSTSEDTAKIVNVLANDTDIDGDTPTISAIMQGANGSVVNNNNGTVTYTPAANFFGSDSFTYLVSDGNGGTDTATVSITVIPVNDAPNIKAGTGITRQQNAGGSVSPIASISDVDNVAGNLIVTVLNAPTGIVVSNIANNNGAITAVVSADCAAALGDNTVVLQVSDDNLTATTNLTVFVTPSKAPVITLKPFITFSAPTHKYQTISLNQMVQSVSDDCSGNLEGSVVIERVTSDEAENGDDDGDTLNDIIIGADCKTVLLRAERSGTGNGRVYTVTLRVSDSSGNVTRADYKAFVQLGNQTPIDDGAVYTVNSNCP
jgi:hypothetical protein